MLVPPRTTAAIAGNIDGQTAPGLQTQILDVLTSASSAVFDVTEVAYMSSAGFRMLLLAYRSLAIKGGKLALVSDYPATDKLNALGMASLFDLVVSNGEPGGPSRLKPHPEGYLSAAERLGVAPSACLVIGDRDDADGQIAFRIREGLEIFPGIALAAGAVPPGPLGLELLSEERAELGTLSEWNNRRHCRMSAD